MPEMLNHDLLPENTCFGCGHHNRAGLHIEVVRDPADTEALLARFVPSGEMVGFPGIVHGGAIFTALDCLSTWVSTLLGPNRHAAWILRSAQTVFHKPAFAGKPLALAGRIEARGGAWDPLSVRCEARDGDGDLCVEGEFKTVPLSAEKFKRVAGIDEIPANWMTFLNP